MIYINVSPIAFSIGTFVIRWYGIFVALAVLTVVLWGVRQVRQGSKISYDTLFNAALVGIPSGVIVSRLLHVIDKWEYYLKNPGQIIGGEGLTIYGGVLGAALGIWLYSKLRKGFQFAVFGDMIAPGIILSQAVGRVGCILNGCCYGSEVDDLFCAFIYSNPESYAPLGIPVHPTQLYEIIFDLIVFLILVKLKGRLTPEGSLFKVYFSLYAFWRIGIEFIRDGAPFILGLHQAQVIGIIVLLVTLPSLIRHTRWVNQNKLESATK